MRRVVYLAGLKINFNFAAPSMVLWLNGKVADLTFRQSSNWSFQWGLFESPDSPSGMPSLVLSQSLRSAMNRIETADPVLTVVVLPFCGKDGISN